MNAVTEVKPQEVMQPETNPILDLIEKVVTAPDLPIERLEVLMNMQERQMAKQAEQAFNVAFAAAMAEMPDIPKSGKNNHSKQTYSTLDDLIRTTRPVLARHGLSLNWEKGFEESDILVTAVVRHSMGHSIRTTDKGQRDSGKQMNHLQGGGSTETYLKRYTGFSILGLSSGDVADDDGRGANTTPINADQFRELRDLIEQAGITDDVVCTAEGIGELHELPAAKFEMVKGKMQTTIENKRKAAEANT